MTHRSDLLLLEWFKRFNLNHFQIIPSEIMVALVMFPMALTFSMHKLLNARNQKV